MADVKQKDNNKEYMKIILFLVALGLTSTMQIKSVLLLFGVIPLIDYARRFAHLTKKEIILEMGSGMVLGLIITILLYFLALLLQVPF